MAEPLEDQERGEEHTMVDVDEQLKQFEKLIDMNDPEQVKMLAEMKKHTSMLHHIRGDWNKPNTFRHWNEPTSTSSIKRIPMESETYREYKKHLVQENTPLLEIAAAGGECPRILGPIVKNKVLDEEDISKPRQGFLQE